MKMLSRSVRKIVLMALAHIRRMDFPVIINGTVHFHF